MGTAYTIQRSELNKTCKPPYTMISNGYVVTMFLSCSNHAPILNALTHERHKVPRGDELSLTHWLGLWQQHCDCKSLCGGSRIVGRFQIFCIIYTLSVHWTSTSCSNSRFGYLSAYTFAFGICICRVSLIILHVCMLFYMH